MLPPHTAYKPSDASGLRLLSLCCHWRMTCLLLQSCLQVSPDLETNEYTPIQSQSRWILVFTASPFGDLAAFLIRTSSRILSPALQELRALLPSNAASMLPSSQVTLVCSFLFCHHSAAPREHPTSISSHTSDLLPSHLWNNSVLGTLTAS